MFEKWCKVRLKVRIEGSLWQGEKAEGRPLKRIEKKRWKKQQTRKPYVELYKKLFSGQ